jgi:hypothetical protein
MRECTATPILLIGVAHISNLGKENLELSMLLYDYRHNFTDKSFRNPCLIHNKNTIIPGDS